MNGIFFNSFQEKQREGKNVTPEQIRLPEGLGGGESLMVPGSSIAEKVMASAAFVAEFEAKWIA